MGINVVIRDSEGKLLVSLSSSISFFSQLFSKIGMENIQLEGDALTLMNAIKKKRRLLSMVRQLSGIG